MDFNLDRVAANMTRNMLGTDITSNNLANIGTTGFKRDATFTDWYMEALEEGSSQGFTNFDQGELELTGNPLDLAMTNYGFMVVETASGPAYTRNGHFTVDTNGFMSSAQGFRLLGEKGPIPVLNSMGTPGNVQVTQEGEVYVDDVFIDRLSIANVPDVRQLKKAGANLFTVPDDILVTELPPELIDIRQGMLERSNVQPVLEMVHLIELQRNYESTQRVAKAMDQLMGRANQLGSYR